MRTWFLLLFFLLSSFTITFSQAQFANSNSMLGDNDLHSAVPVGIADMNGDGLDDIINLDGGTQLYIQYQTPDTSRPFVRYLVPSAVDSGEQNDICIADFNNDGANDLLIVGTYDRIKVLYSIPNTYEFNLTYVIVNPFFSQGASSGDFNQDGWVDAVILNDNGLNYTLMNDGAGNLVEQDLFDFVTVPASDNSGNYGSVYTDFDMDGDNDFYIAKCRQGITNPTDPRRINVLFVNDGNGNYTQDAGHYGLASGRQTWTADFGDMDNDGDLDCFMTQHDVISELYENIGNDTFINITPSSGLNITGVPLQGMFRDFDNDGFQDILVSGDRVDYYHNNGDKTFTKTDPFGSVVFGTFALGDLNHDGFTDVYASTVIPFNSPNVLKEDILFLNQKNDNHYLALTLKDTSGNLSAIGAMGLLYGPWGIQVREVRGGEQYGVSNGHTIIFGLGDQTTYDSLVIRWPDGTREQFNSLGADRTWTLTKGGCTKEPLNVLDQIVILCNDDSLTLWLDTSLTLSKWSTGETSDTIVLKEKGIYYAILNDNDGCQLQTTPLEISINPDTIKPVVDYIGNTQLCNGEIAFLSLPSALSYQWSSGDTTQAIEVIASGDYYALVQGYCKFQDSDTIHLDFIGPDLPVTTNDTFLLGESAILTATGDNIQWYADPQGLFPLGSGNSIQLDNLEDTVSIYAQNSLNLEGQDFQVGPVSHQGNTKYNGNFINGGLSFEVLEDVVLHQITVFTDSVGTRVITIDNGNDFFFDYEVYLEAGETTLDLDVSIPAGSYVISTDADNNNQVFGVSSPYLWRSSAGVFYPYEIPGVFSITNSTFGEGFYYYFYDWKVSTADKTCLSEFVQATAVLDLGTATDDLVLSQNPILLAPNPTDGFCKLIIKTPGKIDIEMTNMDGVRVFGLRGVHPEQQIIDMDLSAYPTGVYLVRIVQDGKTFVQKIIRL